jgi:CMP-2-keto-3-deoxyoctulosonic acid synthetase
MMVTFREMKVQEIVEDDGLSRQEKIEQLRAIETEARGLQRAASESPMNPGDGWDEELRDVRKALDDLGAEDLTTGAASL